MSRARPGRAALEAARAARLPDVVAPGLRVLFCGINPSLYSAATGWHFARPGNRFWKVLHLAGFTPRQYAPREQCLLLRLGLGLTNLAARPTARADELTSGELCAGAQLLARKVARLRPRFVAVVGLGAYRAAFGRPRAAVGPQPEDLRGARLWALPNPSGVNATYRLEDLVTAFAALAVAAGFTRTLGAGG